MLIGLPLCLAGNFIIPITVRPCMDLLWVSSKWHRWKRAIVAELGEATPEWPGSADQSAQATWMKGNQCSKRISFFFFFFFGLRITLGIWISISANVFLCSAPRLIGTMLPPCLVTLLHPFSSCPHPHLHLKKGASELTLVLAVVLLTGQVSLIKVWPEAKGVSLANLAQHPWACGQQQWPSSPATSAHVAEKRP